MMTSVEYIALHENKKYENECADILNDEWPRSKAARLHMLQQSNNIFPYSIVMILKNDNVTVIGHSRLCMASGRKDHAFVDSVLVKRSLRGKGYGKMLMKATEEIAKRKDITRLYLTTHDKQDFYAHIGYAFCDPILTLGGASNLLSDEQVRKMFGGVTLKNDVGHPTESKKPTKVTDSTTTAELRPSQRALDPTPPSIPGAPALPAPPPPPPPPPQPKLNSKDNKLPVRLDPSKVFWMCKDTQ